MLGEGIGKKKGSRCMICYDHWDDGNMDWLQLNWDDGDDYELMVLMVIEN